MHLHLKHPIVFFDLETTGTSISQDRIIEIAMVKLMPNNEVIRKTNVLNPTIPIPLETSLIHGIYDKDVEGKPVFKDVARDYQRFLEGADLSGFNVLKFDVPMLVEEFLRAGIEFDYGRKRIIDAQKIFHLMEKRTLAAAYKFYVNKELQNSHTAEADAEACMEILAAQIEKYNGETVTDTLGKKIGEISNDVEALSRLSLSNLVDLAGRMCLNDKGEEIFNFGKHRNKKVTAILKEEPAYYDWIMNGDFSLDTKRKLTEIKLRAFKK